MAKASARSKVTARRNLAARQRKKSSAPPKLPRPSVVTITIRETNKQPVRIKTLARPPRIDRPQRIHARRFPPRILEGEERAFHSTTRPLATFAARAVSPDDEIKIVLDTELSGPTQQQTASNVGEPSMAVNGDVVVYTGNWYAAVSSDRGKTFRYIDPSTAFQQFDPPGATFCCDQVVQFIPAIDTFVWLLQYSTANDVDNFQRLAFARTADVAANRWRLFDLTAKSLGVPGTFLDFPDLALGPNKLYITTNIFPPHSAKVGSAVVRIPFASIAAGSFRADRFVTFDHASIRVAQNCGKTAFFAAHENTSTLRVFSWAEGRKRPISTLVGVARWIGGNGYHSRTPDGGRWLDRADPRITGATLAADQLWFAWGVNSGSNQRPKPFIQIARIDAVNLTLIENINVFDPDSATCYAALATNADNEVGISYFIGGGTRYPTHIVGFLAAPRREAEIAAGQRSPLPEGDGSYHWGDYLAVRPAFPDANLFAATGYVMMGAGDGSNRDCTAHFVIFGRKKNIAP
jgi:hypothetical protein